VAPLLPPRRPPQAARKRRQSTKQQQSRTTAGSLCPRCARATATATYRPLRDRTPASPVWSQLPGESGRGERAASRTKAFRAGTVQPRVIPGARPPMTRCYLDDGMTREAKSQAEQRHAQLRNFRERRRVPVVDHGPRRPARGCRPSSAGRLPAKAASVTESVACPALTTNSESVRSSAGP
jgi:hypothetical protein